MSRAVAWSVRLTGVCLVASGLLILPSLADLGASLPLVGLLVLVAGGLYAAREELARPGAIYGLPVGPTLEIAYAGALLAAAVALVGLGASAGELQAYGGLAGLVGMANYFLRPVYGLVYVAGRYVVRSARGP